MVRAIVKKVENIKETAGYPAKVTNRIPPPNTRLKYYVTPNEPLSQTRVPEQNNCSPGFDLGQLRTTRGETGRYHTDGDQRWDLNLPTGGESPPHRG